MRRRSTFIRDLKQAAGKEAVHCEPEVLATYDCDAYVLAKKAPDVVVLPQSTEAVQRIIRVCQDYQCPFTARGSGTGLSGGTFPVEGGVLIGLSRMNRILEMDPMNRTATVETGVINAWLNREAKKHGLFYAPDPSSQAGCTLGGNIAENAGGIHCIKYGVTADHVMGLEVVTPEGERVRLGGKHESPGEVDWLGLFVGSEGTFGIATQAVVRLLPLPEMTKVFLAAFSEVHEATDTVTDIIASGLQTAALEFMDEFTIKAVNEAFDVGFPEAAQAVLLIELDGETETVRLMEAQLLTLLEKYHATQIRTATDAAERDKLWKARKGAVAAYGRILPAFYLNDCVIPRSKLTTLLSQIRTIAQHHDVLVGNVFHAGDGNLHPNILFDPRDAALVRRVLQAGEAILQACLSVGGVLSGEHGIGIEKAKYMSLQYTAEELQVMGRLKTVFDPDHLANPGKIFPSRVGCGEMRPRQRLRQSVDVRPAV